MRRTSLCKLDVDSEHEFKIVKMNQEEKKVGLSIRAVGEEASRAEVESYKEREKSPKGGGGFVVLSPPPRPAARRLATLSTGSALSVSKSYAAKKGRPIGTALFAFRGKCVPIQVERVGADRAVWLNADLVDALHVAVERLWLMLPG